ncbi:MAG: hypothetical protein KF892_20485 [Rhizobacter sp.]|nr:hypothetical protein [Rhizobacter sp.]
MHQRTGARNLRYRGAALAALCAGLALPVLADNGQVVSEKEQKRRDQLALSIACVRIDDGRQWDWLDDEDALKRRESHAKAAVELLKACEDGAQTSAVLTGAGAVTVFVSQGSYRVASEAARADGQELRLNLNGFDLGADGALVSWEPVRDDRIALRFRVRRGAEDKNLWTALYETQGLMAEAPLRVALGWSSERAVSGQAPAYLARLYTIRISDTGSVLVAVAWIAVLLLGSLWTLLRTDTFRDARAAPFWRDALQLRRRLRWELFVNRRHGARERATDQEIVERTLRASAFGSVFKPEEVASGRYREAAERALDGNVLTPDETTHAVLGLALLRRRWRPVRATYSLGRVQVGAWFLFAVATAVFLRIVYGALPELPASMVGLVTLSAATALASYAVDTSMGMGRYAPSQGLMHDILTGPDDKQQLHRFQAVVVNVLLLSVGLAEVVHELRYPQFEASWLAFLGVSGAALTMGKQMTEGAVAQELSSREAASPPGSGVPDVARKPGLPASPVAQGGDVPAGRGLG